MIGLERDKLRSQLDKMTSIEGKLLALKSKADSAEIIGCERDNLADELQRKDRELAQLQRDHAGSKETLGVLQQQNREMQQKADGYRKSAEEFKVIFSFYCLYNQVCQFDTWISGQTPSGRFQ